MISSPERSRLQATDPGASVWVSASAGTGKTRLLTDRLLSLMLEGTEPSRILCLTFTRAAAAEMANRLNERLASWATLARGKLAQEIVELSGRAPEEGLLEEARRLFARVLDTPGGFKIATIHAFCQSLLRRFSLEAGVPPEFAVLEERGAREALAEAAEMVIAAAYREQDPILGQALAVVARHAPEERFAELVAELARDRVRLRAALAGGEKALRARIYRFFSLSADDTAQSLLAAFCAGSDEAALVAAAAALASGSETDQTRGMVIARWCEAAAERARMIEEYVGAFLTAQGEIRKRLITKRAASGDVSLALSAEAERVKAFADERCGLAVAEASAALSLLGARLLAAYERKKALSGLLDYDDLVLKTRDLLRRPGVAPWVLFKLDGGIDHILIDEAQDTNPEQWEIVERLAEEFFSGEGARPGARTIFAVGDFKQSIFSFQGADPKASEKMRRHFRKRVNAARQDWREVPLEVSFRSTEPILKAVDAIFASEAAREGVSDDGSLIRHHSNRPGQSGLVELWPPVPAAEEDPLDADWLPVARRPLAQPQTRLAAAIAATIRGWLDRGEPLQSEGRKLTAGDVMVLVRRRSAFMGELVRALKARGVAVAGADRLLLGEQLAVKDLLALGRFLLFPEDDLNLAAVLKGPLFAIDEETLFDLACGRGEKSLWQRLHERARDEPPLKAIAERLRALLARADFVPPYELYAGILGAENGRRAMLERLGPEAADAIAEFLSLALAYEREHTPSLQGFLYWLLAGESEIKRDFGARPRDEVRILTVHGAKGLEAPVVFLADTMQVPPAPSSLLWSEEEALPLWCPRKEFAALRYAEEKETVRRRQMEEYRRLLYVALTRARDRLYICGWETQRAAAETSWYKLIRPDRDGGFKAPFKAAAAPFDFDATPLIGSKDGWKGQGLRLLSEQKTVVAEESAAARSPALRILPAWIREKPPAESDPPRPLAPSRPSEAEPATLSPLSSGARDRFKRGLLVHRLLESLPQLAASEREAAAARFLALPLHALAAAEQREIRRETMKVLQNPEFAPLFAPGSLAEVPLSGLVDGHAVAGQIDRLVVAEGRVLIVDYKSLRPAPLREDEVAPVYLRQLALYRALVSRIFPGREVRCALLFTEAPHLLPISAERLLAALP